MTLQPVLYSEWTKIRSVRSLVSSLALSVVILMGLGAFACGAYGDAEAAAADYDPLAIGFWSLNFAQISLAVFAMLSLGGEYEKGTITTSLTAVPQRTHFYLGKLVTNAGLALAVALPAAPLTFFLTQGLLGEHGVSLGDPGTVRAVISLILYFPLLTLLCMGLAAMTRSLAATLGLLLPFLFLLSPLSMEVPGLWKITQFLPDRAGLYAILSSRADPDVLYNPWLGPPITAVWAAAAVVGGWQTLRSRDA
ncbi:ABC transporter permease [Frankia sp. CcI49]|uniref:ABC transporter permease subunit n=1 Tax=unclassified Frankia TaxID=2632575 RepID=UPI0006CA05DD|nr:MULTISPECIES: ABC transporter permease subunit [unclassified Frankia]KPM53399.1 ABC transporter permease [Frankia sp. R43]ONH54678.1 ABC transporter permease [Frankia sp. CcI49]